MVSVNEGFLNGLNGHEGMDYKNYATQGFEDDYDDHNLFVSSDGLKCHEPPTPVQIFFKNTANLIFDTSIRLIIHTKNIYKLGAGIVDTVANISLKVAKATKSFWIESDFVNGLAVFAKVTAAMGGSIALYQFFKGMEKILTKDEIAKQIDGMLSVMESMSSGIRSAVSSAELLVLAEKVSENAIQWTFVATLFSVALSAASLISAAKGWSESREFLKEAQEKFESIDFQTGIQSILDMKGVKKHFQMNREALKEKIYGVLGPNPDKKITKKVVQSLKNRVESKIISHQLSILAGTINLIGAAVFLFTPLAKLGYSIMAVAGMISVCKYFYNKYATNTFENEMKRFDLEARNKELELQPVCGVNFYYAPKKNLEIEEAISWIPSNKKDEIYLTA
jgi:hypothetical protein